MNRQLKLFVFVNLIALASGCGSGASDDTDSGSGGSSGAGVAGGAGLPGAGGTSAGSGGNGGGGGGGLSGSGGSGPMGGSNAAGGSSATGGTNAAGGSGATGGSGNSSGTGGTAGVGGSDVSGGTSNSGGAGAGAAAGSGGTAGSSATGGASGTAGSAGSGGSGGTPVECDGVPPPVSDQVTGWASVSGDGVATTTGGGGGQTVTASSADQLIAYASSAEPLTIQISGTLNVGTLNVVSNKTLIGMGANTTLQGSVRVRPLKSDDPLVSNVIIRNLKIDASTANPDDGGDGIHIERAHHVWVDHCEVFDAYDGNTDVTHGSNWITVSWTKFHYTDNAANPGHRFSNLIGHSENTADTDRGRFKVTYHHNYWGANVEQRMPRIRFGDVHVYNNYMNAPGAIAAVAAGTEAKVVVENNHFENLNDAHFFHEGSTTAQIVASGNAYVNTTGKRDVGQGSAFTPPYQYTLDPVENVPCDVPEGAGPR
jgi:pectate lyase